MQVSTVEVPQVHEEMVHILDEFGNVLEQENLGSIVSGLVEKASALNILENNLTDSLVLYQHSRIMQGVVSKHDVQDKLRLFNFYAYYEALAAKKSLDLITIITNFDLNLYSKDMNLAQLEHGFDTVFKLAELDINSDAYYEAVATFCNIARKHTHNNWSSSRLKESEQAYYWIITNMEDLMGAPDMSEVIEKRYGKIREHAYQNLMCLYLDGFNTNLGMVNGVIDAKEHKITIDNLYYPSGYYSSEPL